MKALVLLAHGSWALEAKTTLRAYVQALKLEMDYDFIEDAYLQLVDPSLEVVVSNLVANGARAVDVFPFFLFQGSHVLRDLPILVAKLSGLYPDIEIRQHDCIGYDDTLVTLIVKRLEDY